MGTLRRFSETLLRQLMVSRERTLRTGTGQPAELMLRARDAARAAGGFFGTVASTAETNAAIQAALAGAKRRHDRDEFAAAEAAGLWGGVRDAANWAAGG